MSSHRNGALWAIALMVSLATSAFSQNVIRKKLAVEVPSVVSRSFLINHANPSQVLHLAISIPPANAEALQSYADSVSDPKSRNYRNFLTPELVGERFGVSMTAIKAVSAYLQSQGFTIRLVGKNRLSILADATVSQAEKAFATVINDYQTLSVSEPGNTRFFANSTPLEVPSSVAAYFLDVRGLESFSKPKPRILNPNQTRVLYNTAPLYNGGDTGLGRNVAITSFDGYRLSNVPLYYSAYGLPTPAGGVGNNITEVHVGGGSSTGNPSGEGDLDIQMVLGMAPLCHFTIYDGAGDLIAVLTQEANDNIADIISESYGFILDSTGATAAHNLHVSMSAQGITYMSASGDNGTTLQPYDYPNIDPEVLLVGGTSTTTDNAGNRTSEQGWTNGGGGWSTNAATFNVLPAWQKGTGVPTTHNFRLSPDVALSADDFNTAGAYYFYFNGALGGGADGTSFACPVFAGSLAVAEQEIINKGGLPADGAGKHRFGRIQNLFYSQNGKASVWYDITVGSNGTLPDGTTSNAGVGWDFATGWGCINFKGFVDSQTIGAAPAPPTNLAATAGNAQASLTWSASTGATSYNVKRATVSGGPYATVKSTSSTGFVNTGLTNGTTYYYVVTAVNGNGESGNSKQASAKPGLSIPAPPTGVVGTPGDSQAFLSWSASTGATSYNVKRASVSGGPYTTKGSSTSTFFSDSNLTNGTTYYYVVTAVNSAGESSNSAQVMVKPTAVSGSQLISNPGFESGASPWLMTAGVHDNSSLEPSHSGVWKAWLCGYGLAHTDSVYQNISIPSSITSAVLTFYMHIDSAETSANATDTLSVQIRNGRGIVVATLASYSNLNKSSGYSLKTFDLSSYKGQTIQLYLVGHEDGARQTSFVVDDFALNTH